MRDIMIFIGYFPLAGVGEKGTQRDIEPSVYIVGVFAVTTIRRSGSQGRIMQMRLRSNNGGYIG